MFQIVPAFAVPFAITELPDCEALNTELAALFLSREGEGARYANPHSSMQTSRQMFESVFEVFAWPEPCVQQLREFCLAALSRAIAQLNGYRAEQVARLEVFSHTWFHITRRGGYFGLHNHPMASWSGVYCVSAGRDDGTHVDSGKLHFSNPLQLANMFVDPANAHLRPPYSMAGQSYQLRPGQLVLFPSWVNHEVLPFFGEGERITVAFNAWFGAGGVGGAQA